MIWSVKSTAASDKAAAGKAAAGRPGSTMAAVPPMPEAVPLSKQIALKVSIHHALLDKINLSALEKLSREQIRAEVGEIIAELLDAQREPLNGREKAELLDDVLDELLGLGPLESLLSDPGISDILINGPHQTWIEQRRDQHTPR